MKKRTAVAIAVLISLGSGSLAFGQGDERRNERGRNDRAQGDDRGGDRGGERRDEGQRDRRGNQPQARADDRRGPGAGPQHNFRRGERLSSEYRHPSYVVNDWRGHNLSAPPRGYNWVQTGADYVLVAVATGIIAQILLGR